MKRLIVLVAIVFAALSLTAVAFAAGSGYNPPPQVATVCDAGHGAFGAFNDPALHFIPGNGQPPYFGDSTLGSARGGVTGEVNSDFSAFCNG